MSPSDAMHSILTATGEELAKKGGSLLKNCVRTWLFVRDIDMEYAGVVKGRNRAFEESGLTAKTRFIASTGIGGRQADSTVSVVCDTYSVFGLEE